MLPVGIWAKGRSVVFFFGITSFLDKPPGATQLRDLQCAQRRHSCFANHASSLLLLHCANVDTLAHRHPPQPFGKRRFIKAAMAVMVVFSRDAWLLAPARAVRVASAFQFCCHAMLRTGYWYCSAESSPSSVVRLLSACSASQPHL